MEKLTISEYAQRFNLTREAVFYQIKKGRLNAQQDKKTKKWTIFFEEGKKTDTSKVDNEESEKLKIELAELKAELRVKNEFIDKIENKNQEIIKSKSETIESQKKTIQALEISYTQLELKYQTQSKLLESKEKTENKTKVVIEGVAPKEFKREKNLEDSEKKETSFSSSKIELNEFLTQKNITDSKEREKIRARFKRRVNKDSSLTKEKNGKIYLNKSHNYDEVLKS